MIDDLIQKIVRNKSADDEFLRMAVVGVKTGGSRVGGPELCVWADGNRRQWTRCFYPGSGPLDGGKALLLLD